MRVSDLILNCRRSALRFARGRREAAKLLVVGDGFSILPLVICRNCAADVLVFNNTKVIPAALTGVRMGRGEATPKIEALLHMRIDGSRWKAFAKPGKKLQVGDRLRFGAEGRVCLLGDLDATVEAKGGQAKLPWLLISAGLCWTR
jgi:S-adenosylmethionine:tRNA ribosyltransferase-isomerase